MTVKSASLSGIRVRKQFGLCSFVSLRGIVSQADSNSELKSNPEPSPAAASPATSSSASADSVAGTAAVNPNEGLPDWEPLTPELVEDEAVRGDFMLRCAVVLLAVLIGCQAIAETTVLVHVKTGYYLAAHGWWPPANDVLSATATDHRWVNLSWLWDLVASGLFAIGEGIGLSLGTAVLVAVTWWLLGKTSRPSVSNWWGSILGALTLLASVPQLTGQPEVVTLFGLAVTLWILHSWREATSETLPAGEGTATSMRPTTLGRVALWWLVPVFALWSNLDSRLFLGLATLLLWGIGETVGSRFGRGVLTVSQRMQFWKVFAACAVASLLNPFGWHSLAAPLTLYGAEYPAMRDYLGSGSGLADLGAFSLLSSTVWEFWAQPIMTGVLVLSATAMTLVLNARRCHWRDVLLFLGMTAFALAATHELAAACVIACVIGTLNAQQWYQANFRQRYTVEVRELLFTRGGRAVTVVAFFVLAVLAVNHRLLGTDENRVGLGLSSNLRAMIDGYRGAVAESWDDRPFNFMPRQGDVLIWLNQRPFIDSRFNVFAGREDADLLTIHDQTRRSLVRQPQRRDASTGERADAADAFDDDLWKTTFARFQITHVLPRLTGVRPVAYLKLASSPDWQLTHLGSMCAVLYRQDTKHVDLEKFLAERSIQFGKAAYQTEVSAVAMRSGWPRARTMFQQYVSPPVERMSNVVLEADNLLMHLRAMASGQLKVETPTAFAMALLAVRKANAGLSESPDQALAYQILGEAYVFLLDLEASESARSGATFMNQLRFNQALGAYSQAVLLNPNDLALRYRLMELLRRHNRFDLTLRELHEIERLTMKIKTGDPEVQDSLRQHLQLSEQLQGRLETLRERLEQALDQGANPLELAQQVYQAGFVLEALKLLDSDPVAVSESPPAQVLRGLLLFEVGRVEEAHSQFEFESAGNVLNWRLPASWTRLAHGDYDNALSLWQQDIELNEQRSLTSLLWTLPMVQSPYQLTGQPSVWPVQHTASVSAVELDWTNELAMRLWYTAMCQLETGRLHLAAKTLSGILEVAPETFLRPLIRFYLFVMTDELIDLEPPSEWIPIDGELFAPDLQTAEMKGT